MKYSLYFLSAVIVLGSLSIITPLFSRTTCNTFEQKAKHDLYKIKLAIEAFKEHNNSYPNDLSELAPKYIGRIRKDPWGNPYHYSLGTGNFLIESYGADGASGGTEQSKDISVIVSI